MSSVRDVKKKQVTIKNAVRRSSSFAEAKNLAPFSSDEEEEVSTPESNGACLVSDMKSSPIVFPLAGESIETPPPTRIPPTNGNDGTETEEQTDGKDDAVFKRPSPVKRAVQSSTARMSTSARRSTLTPKNGEFSDSEEPSPTPQNHAQNIANKPSSSISRMQESAEDKQSPAKAVEKEQVDLSNRLNQARMSTVGNSLRTPPRQPELKPVPIKSNYEAHMKRKSMELASQATQIATQIRKEVVKSIITPPKNGKTIEIDDHSHKNGKLPSSSDEDAEEIDVEFSQRKPFDFSSMFYKAKNFVLLAALFALVAVVVFIILKPSPKRLQITGKSKGPSENKVEITREELELFLNCLLDELSIRKGKYECGERNI
jgi:hypothetical protein